MQLLLPNAKQQFIDQNGLPLASGTVGFYFPGTLNPKATYQDAAGTIANTNPVTLDSRGQAIIWGSGAYRQIVKDASGVTIWDQITEDANSGLIGNITDAKFVSGVDYVPGTTTQLTLPAAPGSVTNMWVFFDSAYQADDQLSVSGTTLTFNTPIPVGVQEVNVKIGTTIAVGTPGSGTVTDSSIATGTKLYSRINDIWVTDPIYGADPTGVKDSTTAIVSAVTQAQSLGGARVYFPHGTYLVSSSLVFSNFNNVELYGDGIGATTVKAASSGTFTNGLITFSGGSFIKLRGITWNVNNKSVGTLTPAVFFSSATDIEVSDCEVAHMSVLGIGTSVCSNIRILRNKISLDVAFNSQNNGILISGVSNNVWIDSNDISQTNILVAATNCWITNNNVYNYKYGTGVGVTGDVSGENGPYYVIGNTCTGGRGVDTDGTYVAGMEFNGFGGICANNTCSNNYGVGIASFSYGSTITGNVCFSNGVGGSPLHCAGIAASYQSASQFFTNNIVSGNTCFEPAGASGTQLYGYQDTGDVRLFNNTFIGNNFEHNKTAPFSMAAVNSVLGGVFEGKLAYVGGTLPTGQSASFNVTVTGAQLGDFAAGSLDSYGGPAIFSANVIGPNTVSVTVANLTGGTITLPAGNFRAKVFSHYM
jgi:hypothetical protein